MARSKTSGRWLREHFDDPFVKQAQAEGLRSRAAYKLQEIDEKYGLIKPGMNVVDLGAAPGGWSQYAGRKLDGRGSVVALDILPMDALADVTFIQADFTEEEALTSLMATLGDQAVDLVMSDMAPNISGMNAVDQPRAMYLAELALDFAGQVLRPKGDFLAKVFQGEGSDDFLAELKKQFGQVLVRKPKASRPRSREVYMLARGYKV